MTQTNPRICNAVSEIKNAERHLSSLIGMLEEIIEDLASREGKPSFQTARTLYHAGFRLVNDETTEWWSDLSKVGREKFITFRPSEIPEEAYSFLNLSPTTEREIGEVLRHLQNLTTEVYKD